MQTRRAVAGGLAAGLVATGPAGRAALAQGAPGGAELIAYPSGGLRIDSVLFQPLAEARDGPMAGTGILLLHGAGGAQDDVRLFAEGALRLASLGCVCLLPNYYDATPGQQRSTPTAVRRWRQAIHDGALWLGARPDVEPARVGGLGFSRGGGLGLGVALRDGGLGAFVGVASGSSASPEEVAHRPPVMLIYADRDPVVASRRVEASAQALRSLGVPLQTRMLNSPRHRFDAHEWRAIFDTAQAFFAENLKAG